jgi:hypothetical protein
MWGEGVFDTFPIFLQGRGQGEGSFAHLANTHSPLD